MKKIYLIITGVGILFSSCTTISHTASYENVVTDISNLTVADLKVADKKESHTSEWKWNPLSTVSIDAQKKEAISELLKDCDADVLVEPNYEVTRRGLFRGGSVTVCGYPAKYTNFHPITKEEAEILYMEAGGKIQDKENCTHDNGYTFAPVKTATLRDPKSKIPSQWFVNLHAGSVSGTDLYGTGAHFGFSFGKQTNRIGWYLKADISTIKKNPDYDDRSYAGYGMIGMNCRLWKDLRINAGIGVGTAFDNYDDFDWYWEYGYSRNANLTNFTIPLEVGLQYTIAKHLNVAAGYTFSVINMPINHMPYVGIGISF